ncbi:IS3 family transposase [Actinomadura sp. WMMA1423]|uniref:IS3 family transposase n=1 Tax=Actinomadura sp. WMMA1423 TaxID=2591108 RepID=UPI0011470A34|nr:IS3 family transposase [Actinomadura sp. WMMA1423]
MRYSLVRELAENDIPVAVACRVLGVSRSGYSDWIGRPASIREQHNTELVKMIKEIHEESSQSYGSPRVHAELTLGRGERVSRKRVERLMREAGMQGKYWRKGRRNLVGVVRSPLPQNSGANKMRWRLKAATVDVDPGTGCCSSF